MAKTKPNGYWKNELEKLLILETNKCVEWEGPNTRGYGRVFYDYKWHRAGAVALEWHGRRQQDDKLLVLHKPGVCHNPKCVNYRHLYWGTHAENMSDKFIDRTTMQGELHPRAKLNLEAVEFIRTSGWTDLALSRKYDVDRKTIYAAKHNKTWRYV